jgi:DNA helicase-2/ATP-dependent DNA helicase PcrA
MNLEGFNDQQKEAVLADLNKPVLILAGAGSGKTRVLTYRIAHLIEQGIRPYNILAVTFTNKAAKEMKERLESLVGDKANMLWAGTFHSICLRLLRTLAEKLGYRKGFSIYDGDDQEKICKEILKDYENVDLTPSALSSMIGKWKSDLITPSDLRDKAEKDFERLLATLYDLYQQKLMEANAMDFDDLINNMVFVLQKNKDVLESMQNRFKYVLVDEYQDTNKAQYELISLLGHTHKRIFVVGDDWQCLPEDAEVITNKGERLVYDLQVGDKVQTIVNGEIAFAPVTAKSEPQFASIVKATTASGYVMRVSSNHKVFASLPLMNGQYWYVYLMWRPDKGFRLGITKGGLSGVLASRTHPERPKKLWLLYQFTNMNEAALKEEDLSLGYQVPTQPYFHNGRDISLGQKDLYRRF